MRYFGIKTPKAHGVEPYIWWITNDEHSSWMAFFTQPSKSGYYNPHRSPLYDAIKAYKAIGYECVELEITIK